MIVISLRLTIEALFYLITRILLINFNISIILHSYITIYTHKNDVASGYVHIRRGRLLAPRRRARTIGLAAPGLYKPAKVKGARRLGQLVRLLGGHPGAAELLVILRGLGIGSAQTRQLGARLGVPARYHQDDDGSGADSRYARGHQGAEHARAHLLLVRHLQDRWQLRLRTRGTKFY